MHVSVRGSTIIICGFSEDLVYHSWRLAITPLTETDEKKNDILMFERMACPRKVVDSFGHLKEVGTSGCVGAAET